MAQITLTIPDAVLPRVIEAFAVSFDWTPESGQTKAQFTKARVAEYVHAVTRRYEAKVAELAADARARDEVQVT